jgi:hypothetical protein
MTDQLSPSQGEDIQQATLNEIKEVMDLHQKDSERLEQLLSLFSKRLYEGFENAVKLAQEMGIHSIGTPRYVKHPVGGWRRVMQLPIEDWKIVMVPLVGGAWPNLADEAMIPGSSFKNPCARMAFFVMQHDDPSATAFYDAIILLNGAWFAWGYGWPKQQDSVENTNFTTLAMDLLSSFVKDIHLTWNMRTETTLTQAMDAKRRAHTFGLPGDE